MKNLAEERDGFACQNCGDVLRLIVHHIKPKGRGGTDEIINLITLCKGCHFKAHNFYNYGYWINRFRRMIALKKEVVNLEKYIT